MSWKVEVIADSGGKWYSNAMRYGTHDEAHAAGASLAWRWSAVRDWRVVEVPDEAANAPTASAGAVHTAESAGVDPTTGEAGQ